MLSILLQLPNPSLQLIPAGYHPLNVDLGKGHFSFRFEWWDFPPIVDYFLHLHEIGAIAVLLEKCFVQALSKVEQMVDFVLK